MTGFEPLISGAGSDHSTNFTTTTITTQFANFYVTGSD